MLLLALGTAPTILAWVTIAVALVGALAAVALFYRVVQPALEIERYAGDILEAGSAIARNLEGVDELERTRKLASLLPALSAAYLERRGNHRA